jgi:diguanylate cyclase (GGDEF)-like protein
MKKLRILVVDDDEDIRDVLKIALTKEEFEVIEAASGTEALEAITGRRPDLVILDYKMPEPNGVQVCAQVKKDILLRHLPIVMLTGKSEVSDKVTAFECGADDYIVKPFEIRELIARVRTIIRRTELDLDANPLTRLPGNVSIYNDLTQRLQSDKPFAVCYADLDRFKAYNDTYGFERGDEAIRQTARIIIWAVQQHGNKDDFIGHIGGDDFVFVTTIDKAEAIAASVVNDFDAVAPTLYNQEDRGAGFIMATDRKGNLQKTPLLSISIGIVTNEERKLSHIAQIAEIGAELKEYAKTLERSNYVKDKRK